MNNELTSNYVVEDDLDFDATYEDHEEEEIENLSIKDKALIYKEKAKDFYYNNKKVILIIIAVICFIFLISRLATVISLINDSTSYNNNGTNINNVNNKPSNGDFINGNKNDNKIPVVVFSDNKIYLNRNNSSKLFVSVLNIDNYNISYKNSDSSVVSIDNGYITGLKLGKSTITASIYYNGKEYSDKCEVIVIDGVSSVSLNSVDVVSDIDLFVGDEYLFDVKYNPSNARIESYFVEYDKNNISLNNNIIKALKVGNSTIIVRVNDFTKYVNVRVSEKVVNNNTDNNYNNNNNNNYNNNSTNNSNSYNNNSSTNNSNSYNNNSSTNNSNSTNSGNSYNNSNVVDNASRYFNENSVFASSYNDALKIKNSNLATISIKANKIKYCVYLYGSSECNPYLVKSKGDKITVTRSGVSVIKYFDFGNGVNGTSSKIYINVVK